MIKTQASSIIHMNRLLGYTDLLLYMINTTLYLINRFPETSTDTATSPDASATHLQNDLVLTVKARGSEVMRDGWVPKGLGATTDDRRALSDLW